MLPMISGWAYTWPSTPVLKIWPNFPPCTADWVSVGSFRSQPSRRLFWSAVGSPEAVAAGGLACAEAAAPTGDTPAAARPATVSAVAASTEQSLRVRPRQRVTRWTVENQSDRTEALPGHAGSRQVPGGEGLRFTHDGSRFCRSNRLLSPCNHKKDGQGPLGGFSGTMENFEVTGLCC